MSVSDKKLLLIAAGLMLLLSTITVMLAPPNQVEGLSVPSSYSSAPGGALAAYVLLQQLQYPVSRWEDPPGRLIGSNAVLILAEPSIPPVRAERDELLGFVTGGGRVLFCGSTLGLYFKGASVQALQGAPDWKLSSANLPSPFARGAPVISIRSNSRWMRLTAEQLALYGREESPDVVLWRIGKGEILWWAGASPLSNTGIDRANNVSLFLNSVSSLSPRRIYWDEYFHGVRSSLWSYVEATPIKWAILQLAALFGAALFSFSRRSGPVVAPRGVSRQSPLEFVDTLGSLYQRAGAQNVAVNVPYRHLRWNLARRLRLPSESSDDVLAQGAAERLGWNHAGIASAFQLATLAQVKQISTRDALNAVQTIEQFTNRLKTARTKMEND